MKKIPPIDTKTFELAQFHFRDEKVVQDFISKIPLKSTHTVVEIGPGQGMITKNLAPIFKEVLAIEIDESNKKILSDLCHKYSNINLIWHDFLTYSLPIKPYQVIANIPFNITRKILQKIVTADVLPEVLCLVIQKEVSDKICRPENEHTLLSAYIQNFYQCKIIKTFQRNDYQPPAHVDTVGLLLELKANQPSIDKIEFFNFISIAFDSPGQPLKNRLKKHFTFNQLKRISSNLKINLASPPFTLSTDNWKLLFETYQELQ